MRKARWPRGGSVAPKHESPRALDGGRAQGISKPRGPLESRSRTGVSRAVESPADSDPSNVPTLDSQIGESLIEVLV